MLHYHKTPQNKESTVYFLLILLLVFTISVALNFSNLLVTPKIYKIMTLSCIIIVQIQLLHFSYLKNHVNFRSCLLQHLQLLVMLMT